MIMAAESMTPNGQAAKGRITKRSSNSYSSEEWKRHRPLIAQLYSEDGRTLKEVREHLEEKYGFAPTERMYKSRLHAWGLDKKKKEHEMLDLVRQGLNQKGADKDKVFMVRGKQVTLADALHYFNRKGIKDPASLLEDNPHIPRDHSSPDEYDVQTPNSSKADNIEPTNAISDSDYELSLESPGVTTLSSNIEYLKSADLATPCLQQLCRQLGISNLPPLPSFQTLDIEAHIQDKKPSTGDNSRYFDAIFAEAQRYYRDTFHERDITLGSNIINKKEWSSTSDESLSDQFYYLMYHGYSYLWNDQQQPAFENFQKALEMVEPLLREGHVSFLIYIFDLVVRHDGTGYEEPLLMLLQHLTRFSEVVWENTTNPIYLISSWLLNAPPDISKSWVALSVMRKLLNFFQDSIGYFHQETMALLQTFATGLLNAKLYRESAIRFQQLVEAVTTTKSRNCYEAAYALRSTSEAFFHNGQYRESLQAINMALESSRGIPWLEEREIHVRCLRALAEISNVTGNHEQAQKSIGHVVEICVAVFGPDHTFSKRARMHQKSIRRGESSRDTALPPMVYRLGRGGSAAKYVWTTRSSPTRLQT